MALATVASPPDLAAERRVLLPRVSWATYERLLADDEERRVPRLTYDRGVLEIMSPSAEHERRNDTLKLLVNVVAEELGIDIVGFGSTTFRRRDLERGFEPDSSFYVQHEPHIRQKLAIDLTVDPPPDVVVEIDVANSSLDKLPLYARLGIPEVWRDEGERLRVLLRHPDGEGYDDAPVGRALPLLTADALTRWLAESRTQPRTAWLRAVREWVRAQATPIGPTT